MDSQQNALHFAYKKIVNERELEHFKNIILCIYSLSLAAGYLTKNVPIDIVEPILGVIVWVGFSVIQWYTLGTTKNAIEIYLINLLDDNILENQKDIADLIYEILSLIPHIPYKDKLTKLWIQVIEAVTRHIFLYSGSSLNYMNMLRQVCEKTNKTLLCDQAQQSKVLNTSPEQIFVSILLRTFKDTDLEEEIQNIISHENNE